MKRDVSPSTLIVFPDAKYLRTLLKECAKAFFGESDKRRCALIDGETYSDCLILPAKGAKFTVNDAARIVDESLLHPVEEEKKLFVLDAFDTASALVQNKLLKILEEPPAGVYFLLGASGEGAVLPTVLSRMRKLTVPPFSEEAVITALTRNHAGDGELSRAAGCIPLRKSSYRAEIISELRNGSSRGRSLKRSAERRKKSKTGARFLRRFP